MAKIKVSDIEGYAEMTAEEKVAALENFEYEDNAQAVSDLEKYKDAVTKANHEAADFKKQLKALQEQTKTGNTKADETIQSLQQQVAELTRQNTVSSYTAQLTALGYSPELAKETAEAQADGDVAKVMENQRKFLEEHEKNLKAELLKQTPRPGQGGTGTPSSGMTKEKFKKLSFADRAKFAAEHPDEYAQFYD